MENSRPNFHGLTMRDGIMVLVLVVSFSTAFIANRTHVNDELIYVTKRIEGGESNHHSMELRVRNVELYNAGSQQQIQHLSEQIAMANQKLDRVLERLSR